MLVLRARVFVFVRLNKIRCALPFSALAFSNRPSRAVGAIESLPPPPRVSHPPTADLFIQSNPIVCSIVPPFCARHKLTNGEIKSSAPLLHLATAADPDDEKRLRIRALSHRPVALMRPVMAPRPSSPRSSAGAGARGKGGQGAATGGAAAEEEEDGAGGDAGSMCDMQAWACELSFENEKSCREARRHMEARRLRLRSEKVGIFARAMGLLGGLACRRPFRAYLFFGGANIYCGDNGKYAGCVWSRPVCGMEQGCAWESDFGFREKMCEDVLQNFHCRWPLGWGWGRGVRLLRNSSVVVGQSRPTAASAPHGEPPPPPPRFSR